MYTSPNGTKTECRGAAGTSVMALAAASGQDGIVAECGGSLMCATCHVYVDPNYLGLLGAPGEEEHEMLECTASPREANSRLSCQISLTADLDGIEVAIPPTQL